MKKADVIKYFGSQQKVADFIGKTRASVGMWSDPIPLKWAVYLDATTSGALEFDKTQYQRDVLPQSDPVISPSTEGHF